MAITTNRNVEDTYINTIVKDATDRMASIHKSLVLDEDDTNRIPEYLFVNNFLPYFCGEKDIEPNSNFFIDWISIAGSPTKHLYVVDDSDLNKILFKVPGLYNTVFIKTLNKNVLNNNSFGKIFDSYHYALSGSNTSMANSELIGRLNSKFKQDNVDITSVFSETEKAWNTIFERYGKKLISHTKKTTQTIRASEDIDFDGFSIDD